MILSWQIGEVTIRRVVELQNAVPYHPKYPLITEARPGALQHMPWLYPLFVNPPRIVDGVPQDSIDGVSLAYTFDFTRYLRIEED